MQPLYLRRHKSSELELSCSSPAKQYMDRDKYGKSSDGLRGESQLDISLKYEEPYWERKQHPRWKVLTYELLASRFKFRHHGQFKKNDPSSRAKDLDQRERSRRTPPLPRRVPPRVPPSLPRERRSIPRQPLFDSQSRFLRKWPDDSKKTRPWV